MYSDHKKLLQSLHGELEDVAYDDFSNIGDYLALNISHHMTDAGLEKFTEDWNKLLKK